MQRFQLPKKEFLTDVPWGRAACINHKEKKSSSDYIASLTSLPLTCTNIEPFRKKEGKSRLTFYEVYLLVQSREREQERDESRGLLCQINTRSRRRETREARELSCLPTCLAQRQRSQRLHCQLLTLLHNTAFKALFLAFMRQVYYYGGRVSRSFLFIQLSLEMAKILESFKMKIQALKRPFFTYQCFHSLLFTLQEIHHCPR